MKDSAVTYRPIGVICGGHTVAERTPIQPAYAKGCRIRWMKRPPRPGADAGLPDHEDIQGELICQSLDHPFPG
jgi:hypothetical protein